MNMCKIDKYLCKSAERVIGKLVADGRREFIIYPFGECGKYVKSILNTRYGIEEKYVIDNYKKEEQNKEKIYKFDAIKNKQIEIGDAIVLVCTLDSKAYSTIRNGMIGIISNKNVVDVFSYSMYYDDGLYHELAHFDDARVAALEMAAREIYRNKVPGDIAECGVYKGGFAKHIARFLPDRRLYLFDTFEGFDKRDIDEREEVYTGMFRKEYKFDDTSVDQVINYIGPWVNIVVKKGYFPDTTVGLENERFSFVSLDTDLYKPILSGLQFFYPRLNPGGYIFVDDFGQIEGVRDAVLEYCKGNNVAYVRLMDRTRTAIIAKPLA